MMAFNATKLTLLLRRVTFREAAVERRYPLQVEVPSCGVVPSSLRLHPLVIGLNAMAGGTVAIRQQAMRLAS